MSSAYPNPLYFAEILDNAGSITKQNSSIDKGSPWGTPASILSANLQ